MTHRVIHLSDLHFGRERPDLVVPLAATVNRILPDVIVVSGDLTQRARRSQFEAASAFLKRLEAPVVTVPGNHDVPLYNLPARLIRPYANYRRAMGDDLEPVFRTEGLTVVGLNTVDPHVWQRGKARATDVDRACSRFSVSGGKETVRILVAHHPFEQAADDEKTPMKGAGSAIDRLSACGVDIVLAGHLHTWRAGLFTERVGQRRTLQIQAGTSLSTRVRGEENDFNLLIIDGDDVLVERWACTADCRVFAPGRTRHFALHPNGWSLSEAGARKGEQIAP